MEKKLEKQMILIDGSSYLFRAYHALPPLTTSTGNPTGAVYGVINMIRKLMKTHPFDYIGVIFDPKGKTFRHTLYPEYKANRTVMPDELRVQIEPLFHVIKAMGLPLITQDGVEADDIIGTLAIKAQKKDIRTLISTMDKDMAQLVSKQVTLINTMSDRTLDIAGVKEKFGVMPEQIIDYLALMGDTSDNIPGIPKVGPKTAATWLAKYHSLENIITHASEITGKVGENLRAHINDLTLSRQLVTIDCDVKLAHDFDELQLKTADQEKLHQLFSELEFTSWLKDLQKDHAHSHTHSHYYAIQDEKSFQDYLKKLEKVSEFAFDSIT